MVAAYERALRAHANNVLLDLGCGFVPLYGIYKDLVSEAICVDWPNTLHKSPHLDETWDLNQPLRAPDAQYDTVLLTDVLEHIAEPAALMAEIARLLKPNGKLIVGVPFYYWLHERPHDYYRYTEFALRRFCEKNGLTVITLEPYGGVGEILVDLIAKQIGRWPLLSAVHLAMSQLVLGSSTGKKHFPATARTFPLGYCMVAQKTTPVWKIAQADAA